MNDELRQQVIDDLASDPGAPSDALDTWRGRTAAAPDSSAVGENCGNCSTR